MSQSDYVAEVASAAGGILVTVSSSTSTMKFSRSFRAICDAERWLLKLVHVGLNNRDCVHFKEKELIAFELPPMRSIQINDKRRAKRCVLPAYFK